MKQNQNSKLNPIIYFVICLIFMIMFNLYTTNFILNNISIINDNLKLIDLVYIQNTGAAFSSFQHMTTLLIIISIIAILAITYELIRNYKKYSLLLFLFSSILIAGIFCNTLERITLGYVQDFISFKFITFPVFNISDILINFGVLAIMYLIITKKYLKNDE